MSRSDELVTSLTERRDSLRQTIASAVASLDAKAPFTFYLQEGLREASILTGAIAELEIAKS
jgi:hypothetical protein